MRVLDRYIFRETAFFTLVSLTVFTSILVIARMLKLTSLVVNKGVGLSEVLTIFISIIPTFLEVALPVSTLLGVMLAIGRLSADSELVVIRASGISLKQLIRPVIYLAILVCAVNLIVSSLFRPIGQAALSKALFKVASTRSTAGLTAGTFNDLGTLTLYAEEIDPRTGLLRHVLVDDRRDSVSRQIITSKRGKIVSDEHNQTINFILSEGTIHSSGEGGDYNFTDFQNNILAFRPEELTAERAKGERSPREMLLPELRSERENLIDSLQSISEQAPSESKTQGRIHAIELEIVRKYSMPVACIILALLAMPLGVQPARSHNSLGATLSILLGIIVVVTYYILLSLALTFGQDGTINPYISLWIPNLFFGVVAIWGLQRMGSERWSNVVHAIEDLITNIGIKSGMIRQR